MAKHSYALKDMDKEHTAMAVGRSLPISTKHSIEISKFIRHKKVQRAKTMLNEVMAKKLPVPFKRFQQIPHKKGHIASGAFPEKAAKEFLGVLESAEANAQFKGLNTSSLIISHICAHKASNQQHNGRLGRSMKRTHVEIVVKEASEKEEDKKEKVVEKKPVNKTEIKTAEAEKKETKSPEKKTEPKKQEVKTK